MDPAGKLTATPCACCGSACGAMNGKSVDKAAFDHHTPRDVIGMWRPSATGAEVDEVGAEILDLFKRVASGAPTKSEVLGHTEFILTYKSFEPIGPACLPV